jgi:hypothetical protein
VRFTALNTQDRSQRGQAQCVHPLLIDLHYPTAWTRSSGPPLNVLHRNIRGALHHKGPAADGLVRSLTEVQLAVPPNAPDWTDMTVVGQARRTLTKILVTEFCFPIRLLKSSPYTLHGQIVVRCPTYGLPI